MKAAHAEKISDFPDKLNPMLVKELRQGLRGISFIILFIAVQAFLCFIMFITAIAASHENAGHLLSRTIFFFFSLAVLSIQPLRGISSLHGEIKNNTIDLLCLTRLSAWRIAYGKWISIVSQSALILSTIIPYLILRYFFGDMQIFSEILLLISIFLLSALFTAGTVGLSATNSSIIRVLLPIVFSLFVFVFIWSTFAGGRENFLSIIRPLTLDSLTQTLFFIGLVTTCIYITWMLLDLGASLIAPIAENRATRRRLVSLGLITTTLFSLKFAHIDADATIYLGLALSIPVCIISLTENPQLVQPIVAPFTRRGILGTTLGRILYPGWATGLLFSLVLYALLHTYIILQHENHFVHLNWIFAAVLFPLVLTRIFARKHENRFGLFMLFTCTQFLIVLIIFAAETWGGSHQLKIMQYFCWIPSSFIYLGDKYGFSEDTLLQLSYINLAVYTGIALATSFPVWKHIRELERMTSNES